MTARKQITIITPENVFLKIELAEVENRIYSFMFDLLLILFATVVIIVFYILFCLTPFHLLAGALSMIMLFVIWNGYFIYFELKNGATPGKKMHDFRIVKQDGTALSPSSIYIRNLLREIEIWLPLRLLIVVTASSTWEEIWRIVPFLWIIVFTIVPFVDKKNRRLGDLIAGTLVVIMPKQHLEEDLVVGDVEISKKGEEITFTDKMLEIYGKKELETLEDILRRCDNMQHEERKKLLSIVVKKIQKKIGYEEHISSDKDLLFLQTFYRAQRNRLEKKLVRGEIKDTKNLDIY